MGSHHKRKNGDHERAHDGALGSHHDEQKHQDAPFCVAGEKHAPLERPQRSQLFLDARRNRERIPERQPQAQR